MIIRILEIAGVASPKGIFRTLDYLCTGSFGLFHDRVNLFFAADIVANGELGGAAIGFGRYSMAITLSVVTLIVLAFFQFIEDWTAKLVRPLAGKKPR